MFTDLNIDSIALLIYSISEESAMRIDEIAIIACLFGLDQADATLDFMEFLLGSPAEGGPPGECFGGLVLRGAPQFTI